MEMLVRYLEDQVMMTHEYTAKRHIKDKKGC